MEQINVLWVLLCTFLVFLMQAGFLCLEAGLARKKNNINVAAKNITDFCVAIVLFWIIGYSLMFGENTEWMGGMQYFALDFTGTLNTEGNFFTQTLAAGGIVHFLFQAVFCGTAVTIISGATAERMYFPGYVIVAILIGGLIYPWFGYLAWSDHGWLANAGFIDFAGSTVVHSIGGWAALAVLLVLGARRDRFPQDKSPQILPKSNLPVAVLGVLILWFGWFGFNGGSGLAFDKNVPVIIVNTMIAGAAGLVTVLVAEVFWSRLSPHKTGTNVSLLMNGVLAGLVAITASANMVNTPAAVIIGAIGAVVMLWVDWLLERIRIDDVVGAIPVHLAAGVWGTLAVALFGNPDKFAQAAGDRGAQFFIQFQGVFLCFVIGFGATYLILWVGKKFSSSYIFRVSDIAEQKGLNISEHEEHADYSDLDVLSYLRKTD